jgi:pyroglutamyl-peptidase
MAAHRSHPAAPLLLTGFDPFGGSALNPSWLAARALHGQRVAGHTVVVGAVAHGVRRGAGSAAGAAGRTPARAGAVPGPGRRARRMLSVERIAINLVDARIPDNQGEQPVDAPVVPAGPAAYFATLPVKALHRAAQRAGLPCEVSQTAGTFVCNAVFYGLMHQLATGAAPLARGGFVHVPWLPEQGTPGMQLRDMVRGIHAMLWAAVLYRQDIALGAGALH